MSEEPQDTPQLEQSQPDTKEHTQPEVKEDVQPEVKEDTPPEVKEKIAITVQYGEQQAQMHVSRKTRMEKIFQAAEKRWNVDSGTFKYYLDGNRILETHTVAELQLEDGDVIDAFLEQVGGAKRSL